MINVFKERPIQSIGALLGILGSLILGIIWVDDRYALHQDVENVKTELTNNINSTQEHVTTILKEQAIIYYEDQLMELNYKKNAGNATPFDNAKKEHIEGRLKGLRAK